MPKCVAAFASVEALYVVDVICRIIMPRVYGRGEGKA